MKPPENAAADPGYWIARWSEGRTGFHRASVQPWLVEHAAKLAPKGDERVLVPLCGKSVDLVWLESRGHRVSASTSRRRAFQEFSPSSSAARPPSAPSRPSRSTPPGDRALVWRRLRPRSGNATGRSPAIFDRAALIAFPMRAAPSTRASSSSCWRRAGGCWWRWSTTVQGRSALLGDARRDRAALRRRVLRRTARREVAARRGTGLARARRRPTGRDAHAAAAPLNGRPRPTPFTSGRASSGT